MQETALQDLDPRLQQQIENARKAVSKNPVYAIDILMNIMERHTGCLEARKILRQTQKRANKGNSGGLSKLLSKFSIGGSKPAKDPVKAIQTAESLLNSNPNNVAAHKQLAINAEALELFGTAAFAYEEIYRLESSNLANIKSLMEMYIKLEKNEDAIRLGEIAYRDDPSDDEIQHLVKKASVAQTVEKGNWDKDDDFRQKLKDEDEALKLEQAGRAKTGESGLRSMIDDDLVAVSEEPGNLNIYRNLAANYRKLGEFDNALQWVEKARKTEGGQADVNLERLSTSLQREKMTAAICAQQRILETDANNEEALKALAVLSKQERAYRRQAAQNLIQRYPNEFTYRFELGELLLEDGEIDASIKELQLALRAPKVRVQALILLGKAYKQKEFYDLAAEQFQTAKSEITGLSDEKKEVLYELGSCYELQGDLDNAMREFKSLYGADIGFRDVAQKIDVFYSRKKA
ncbi:MAG: tetratricopeptide repeat protein [Verrucomicrobiota bacterium]|nr:tetratricopeptide repeat protein [Verrucomicrobiota bacterium]